MLSVDLHSIDKSTSSRSNQIILVILIISIALIICTIYCIHQYYCQYQHQHLSLIQTQLDSSTLDRYHLQVSEPAISQILTSTSSQNNTIRHTSQSNYVRRVPVLKSTAITSTNEPPAYTGIVFITNVSIFNKYFSLFFFDHCLIDLFPN